MRSLTIAAWMLLALVPARAGAGVIRGSVEPPTLAAGTIVYLDSIPEKVEKKLAKHADSSRWVHQIPKGFVPGVVGLARGTTVHFLNRDRRYHNVFSVTPANRFDLGPYGPGKSVSETFDRDGPVRIFCELHSDESGLLFVTPNHAFAAITRRGTFVLPKLPPGTYTLKSWHPRWGEQTRQVEIPRSGDAVVLLRWRPPAAQSANRGTGAAD